MRSNQLYLLNITLFFTFFSTVGASISENFEDFIEVVSTEFFFRIDFLGPRDGVLLVLKPSELVEIPKLCFISLVSTTSLFPKILC